VNKEALFVVPFCFFQKHSSRLDGLVVFRRVLPDLFPTLHSRADVHKLAENHKQRS